MYVAFTERQEKLRNELRQYYSELLTPQVLKRIAGNRGIGQEMRGVWKQMCADGWAGIGWPRKYGGQERTAIEQFIFFDESMRAAAPVPMLTINTVGPTIMGFGTEEQKRFFLPRILAGDLHFCIGYSEPEAGTDLANLQTHAVVDGDELVINGQKRWTSLASDADWCWLAVRTNREVPKHKGISIVLVPLRDASGARTPGVDVQPLDLLLDHDLNAVYYTDVRVPATNVVGGIDDGWSLITHQLNHERVTLCSSGLLERLRDLALEWARTARLADGHRVIDQEWVQMALARVHMWTEFLKLANWKVAWSATQGRLKVADASAIKIFGTEHYMKAIELLSDVVGEPAYVVDGPGGAGGGHFDRYLRGLLPLTFGGGVNEVQRDLIASFGLGMPRSGR